MALALVVFALSWERHRSFWSGFDLAIFDQAAWQLSHGRTHISIVERHVLADHFSPVLLVFGVLYRIAATPLWLLGAQAFALGATVLPVRAIARRARADETRASVLVVASAPLLAGGLFEFHPSTLAPPFIALAILFALEDRPVPAVAAALAVVLCRADLAPVVLAVAVVASRRCRWPLVGVAVVAAVVSAVVPGSFGETNGWAPHFGHLGASPVDAVAHPWRIVGELLSSSSLTVLAIWVLAAGIGVMLKPRWLLAVVVAGSPVLLSRWLGTELPWYHYGAPVAPIAIAGTLVALGERGGRDPIAKQLGVVTWLAPALALLAASPLAPGAPEGNRVWSMVTPRAGTDAPGALALVPQDAAVSADQYLLPHLSHRERIYLYPIPFAAAPDFFATRSGPQLDRYGEDAVDLVVSATGAEGDVPVERFRLVGRRGAYMVFQRSDVR